MNFWGFSWLIWNNLFVVLERVAQYDNASLCESERPQFQFYWCAWSGPSFMAPSGRIRPESDAASSSVAESGSRVSQMSDKNKKGNFGRFSVTF